MVNIYVPEFHNPFRQYQLVLFKRFIIGCEHAIYHDNSMVDNISSDPSIAHAQKVQQIWDNKKPGIGMIIDQDMFPVKPFDPEKFIGNYDFATPIQKRGIIKYLWPNLLIFNTKKLSSFPLDFGVARGLDTGGLTSIYLTQTKAKVKDIKRDKEVKDFEPETFLDGTFLHYRASSWNKDDNKLTRFTELLNYAILKC